VGVVTNTCNEEKLAVVGVVWLTVAEEALVWYFDGVGVPPFSRSFSPSSSPFPTAPTLRADGSDWSPVESRTLSFVLNHCMTFLALLVEACIAVTPLAISVLEAFPNDGTPLSSLEMGAVVGSNTGMCFCFSRELQGPPSLSAPGVGVDAILPFVRFLIVRLIGSTITVSVLRLLFFPGVDAVSLSLPLPPGFNNDETLDCDPDVDEGCSSTRWLEPDPTEGTAPFVSPLVKELLPKIFPSPSLSIDERPLRCLLPLDDDRDTISLSLSLSSGPLKVIGVLGVSGGLVTLTLTMGVTEMTVWSRAVVGECFLVGVRSPAFSLWGEETTGGEGGSGFVKLACEGRFLSLPLPASVDDPYPFCV
jgi:hypothetical protein